jgi:formylglycine-generating enzyme required for sulfatase activity
MKDVLVGRVDLVRALDAGGTELQDAVAQILGLQREPKPSPPPDPEPDKEPSEKWEPEIEPEPAPIVVDVPFWQAQEFEALEPRLGDESLAVAPAPADVSPVRLPSSRLAAGADILTRLRRYSAFADLTGGIDVDRTVFRLSRGVWLRHFPRKPRKRWGQMILVIGDRARRLAPYWLDQDLAIGQLKRVFPQHGFQLAILDDGATVPRALLPSGKTGPFGPPDPGTVVLVLGDLGCLARRREERERLMQTWLEWGRRLKNNGNPALALVPCHPSRCRGDLARLWTILPWEGGSGRERPPLSDRETEEVSDQVVTRLAFALRVEPRLVRAVRRMLPEGRVDAGIESFVWQHDALESRHHEAATFDPTRMRSLLPAFFRLSEAERKRIYDLVREVRRNVYPGVWFSELLALERDVARGLLDRQELRQAAWWCQRRYRDLDSIGTANDPAASEPAWFRRVFARLPESVNQGSAARTLHQIWTLVRPDEEVTNLPDFLDPALMPPSSTAERMIALKQVADRLVAEPFSGNERGDHASDMDPPGSLLGLLRTRNGLVRIDRLDEFWEGGVPPGWASNWGCDQHGAWVEFQVDDVTQRLRWIPPGRFMMGSPEDEKGRFADEGPRHEELIESGFWMFDTPCTQSLWRAVMGNNPSRIQGADRPVENVSWKDCHAFIARLNERLGGLCLALPNEAQWEYACRAGTETPRYRENLEEIAWYLGNSEGQTHPVALKAPNDWGLHDTLGNVWEWCADAWSGDYQRRPGKVPDAELSARRVLRGGSWIGLAWYVRAACRDWDAPAYRLDGIGFRCADFRAPGPVARGTVAEPRETGAETNGASWLRPGEGSSESGSISISLVTPIRARTDVETLTIRPVTLPPWATAVGRDRYGLWAEFTIDPLPRKQPSRTVALLRRSAKASLALAPVRQRLRWIPPGRFRMGSPEGEEGRFDWESPQCQATIESGFWMFDTPCTQALWDAVMGEGTNPSRFPGADRPVEQVSWEGCQLFLKRLGERLEGLGLGLPSEGQWEYACRAGTTAARYHERVDEIAWYGENSGVETHPVGRKAPNSWGLFDILGNVWEWCADRWLREDDESHAPQPAGMSVHRVVRGGSWVSDPHDVRAAYRVATEPSARLHSLGFRCAEFRGVIA